MSNHHLHEKKQSLKSDSHMGGHGHSHGHHHHTPTNYGKIFFVGIALNSVFALIELIYGQQVESLSLMTDAIHNFGDVFGLIIAWVGFYFSKSAKSLQFTYGLRKFSILAAFLNALILVIGTLWLMYEAADRFQHQQMIEGLSLIIVASIGIFINFFTAFLFYKGSQHDLNMKGAFLHLLADGAVSLCVVIGGFLIMWQSWTWVDPVISLLIGFVILWGTWGLLKESTVLVLGGVPNNIDLEQLTLFLKKQNGIQDVHDLHVWAMSTTEVAMTVHFLMPKGHPGDQFLADLSHELIHEFNINHSTFQIEIGDTKNICSTQHPGAV